MDGELNWRVPPLSLPEAGSRRAVSILAPPTRSGCSSSGRSWCRPSFRVTDENAAAVAVICRRLDGLPLAIELAAARMRILSSAQLAERLDDIFAVLVGGARSAPPRHQALRATLDWSHDMLDADERAVFRRLATFAGGFTPGRGRAGSGRRGDPARSRAGAADPAGGQVAAAGGARPRRRPLPAARHGPGVRAGTAGRGRRNRLGPAGSPVVTSRSWPKRPRPGIERGEADGAGAGARADRLDAELPNLRRAFEFAQEAADPVAALRIAGALGRYAYLRGHYQEVRQWMDAAVTACPDAPAGLRAEALLGSGRLALLQCDYAPAMRRLEAALRLYRELEDTRGIAGALQVLGSVAREQGRYARATSCTRRAWSWPRPPATAGGGQRPWLPRFASWLQRDFDRATAESTAGRAVRGLGDIEGIAWSLISLGTVARYQGAAHARPRCWGRAAPWPHGSGSARASPGASSSLACWRRRATRCGGAAPGSLSSTRVAGPVADLQRAGGPGGPGAGPGLRAAGGPAAGGGQALRSTIGTVIPPCERR